MPRSFGEKSSKIDATGFALFYKDLSLQKPLTEK